VDQIARLVAALQRVGREIEELKAAVGRKAAA
jgi:hypothetical protein